jgi:hypothetical protein
MSKKTIKKKPNEFFDPITRFCYQSVRNQIFDSCR